MRSANARRGKSSLPRRLVGSVMTLIIVAMVLGCTAEEAEHAATEATAPDDFAWVPTYAAVLSTVIERSIVEATRMAGPEVELPEEAVLAMSGSMKWYGHDPYNGPSLERIAKALLSNEVLLNLRFRVGELEDEIDCGPDAHGTRVCMIDPATIVVAFSEFRTSTPGTIHVAVKTVRAPAKPGRMSEMRHSFEFRLRDDGWELSDYSFMIA